MKNILLLLALFLCVSCSGAKEKEGETPEPPATSAFVGKNLVAFGNSITAATNSWAYQVQTGLGFRHLYNGAVGGAIWSKRERTTSTGANITTQDFSDPNFAGISNETNNSDLAFQRIINNCAVVHIQKYLSDRSAPKPDFAILSYGTNDLTSDAVIGDAEAVLQAADLADVDLFTMAGALRWSIETLRAKYPDIKLYVALPLQAKDSNKNTGNLKKIAVITKICDAMSVPYFDCYAESGITQANEATYLRDGLHPNADGQAVHAAYIIKKLEEANQ